MRLSYFASDAGEFWRMLTDVSGGPLAPFVVGLDTATLDDLSRRVVRALDAHRAGDVLRIPAQAQLAWGRA